MPRTIVVAWKSERTAATRWTHEPRAAVWLNEGTSRDLHEAREYAAREGYRVFVFPITEPFPLRAARALI
jgi:hypothetical protein